MTSMQLRAVPRFGRVLREQFKATALSLKVPTMIAIALLAVATFLTLADYLHGHGGVEFAPELSLIPAFAGILLPIIVWQREKHFESGFIWTFPVNRSRHALARVTAAWTLLMTGVALFMVWLLILALITKGNVTGDEVVRLLPSTTIPEPLTLAPSALRTITWIPPRALWLAPFTAATTMYIIASAVMVGLRYPFRWIIALIALFYLTAAAGQGLAADIFWTKVQSIVRPLMEGRYGIDSVLSARSESLHTEIVLANAVRTTVWRALPVVSDWLIATLIWTSAGLAALAAALFRHRERR
jgi:hypothetical protein